MQARQSHYQRRCAVINMGHFIFVQNQSSSESRSATSGETSDSSEDPAATSKRYQVVIKLKSLISLSTTKNIVIHYHRKQVQNKQTAKLKSIWSFVQENIFC